MSRTTTRPAVEAAATAAAPRAVPEDPAAIAAEVATVLAGMTYRERVRAYRSGAFSAHELAVAAAWLPDDVPLLNDEYEWIVVDLADHE